MSKYIFISIATLCVMLGCASCNDSMDTPSSPTPGSPGSLTLTFRNSASSRSIASDNSEILIDNLYIGLYPLDASDTDNATAWTSYSYLGASQSKVVTMQLNDAVSNALFSNTDGKKCRIFALANVPEGINVPRNASIETMKALSVKSDFKSGKAQTSFIMSGGNDFVMYSAPPVQGQKGKAEGAVELIRTAAKIRLNVSLPEKIEIKDDEGNVKETWHPVMTGESINAALINGVCHANAVAAEKPLEDDAYFDSDLVALKKSGNANYPYTIDVPFYTYPNLWTESTDETHKTTISLIVPWYKEDTPDAWSTFYYQVPVTPVEVTQLESNHSYNVNISVGMLGSLVPDTPVTVEDVSYQIVNWGVQEVDVPIEDSRYLVVNPNVYTFNNETNMSIPYYTSHPVEIVDVKIQYQRFNFVSDPDNNFVGEVVSFTIDEDQITRSNESNSQKICETSLYNTTGQDFIRVFHPLNLWTPMDEEGNEVELINHNDVKSAEQLKQEVDDTAEKIWLYKETAEDAFSMYTITLTIRHKDHPEYKEDIVIYQYPSIYIEAERNPASQTNGNVYVNGFTNRGSSSSQNVYGSIFGILGSESVPAHNKNPNMYIINITSLSENNTFTVKDEATGIVEAYDYVINDPRAKFCTNGLTAGSDQDCSPLTTRTSDQGVAGSWCTPASSLYHKTGENVDRRLQYYYPTLEDGSAKNSIAPQFRIASSWGVTVGIYRNYARRRCALYQEQQYPSGRWRIPTLAEFCYINKLSNERKIPILFTEDVTYWTSEGLYKGTKEGEIIRVSDQKDQKAVRAVYDEWYWSQYPQYSITPDANGNYTYTLGDVPRGVQ